MNLKDSSYYSGFLTEYLAFGYLASSLRSTGHKVTWIDEHTDFAYSPETFDFLRYMPVDIVGMSPSFATYRRTLGWLGKWKKLFPNIITVLGGQHAMMVPNEILLETDAVDYVCLGEGEDAFCQLAESIYSKKKFNYIPGFAFKKHNIIYRGDSLTFPPSMDNLPFPARDSLEKWIAQKKVSQVSLQNSRGCPYGCKFCHFPEIRKRGYGYGTRFRSPHNVIQEIVYLQNKYGFREFFFNSPQFGGVGRSGKEWMYEFSKSLMSLNQNIRFEIECRSDTLDDPDLVVNLKKAGLIRVFLGLEAGRDEVLKRYGKGISVDVHRKVIKLLRVHNISISGSGFIMLHPLSTLEELRKNAEFLWEIGETHFHSLWSFFRMFPGISQIKKLKDEGLVDERYKHDEVTAYRFMDPRVEQMATNTAISLNSILLERATRLVRLVDIEIGLEEANLPAVIPGVDISRLAELLDIRESAIRLRHSIITAFFDHFLYCLKLAGKSSSPHWDEAGNHLHRNLLVLRPKIDRLLEEHDRLLFHLLRENPSSYSFNKRRNL